MMTTGKECVKEAQSNPVPECCMCGDQGISIELFNCKVCKFRYQHRYCSNLYPKADTYRVCNWCLYQKNDTTEKTQNSSSTSSSHKTKDESMDRVKMKIKIKKKNDQSHQVRINDQKGNLHLKRSKKIEKQKLPGLLVPAATTVDVRRKAIGGGFKERLRRTKSEDISNSSGKKVFKYRVRRYKLLEEVVCSQ